MKSTILPQNMRAIRVTNQRLQSFCQRVTAGRPKPRARRLLVGTRSTTRPSCGPSCGAFVLDDLLLPWLLL